MTKHEQLIDPVSEFALAQLRSFLDELKNGSRTYATVTSLSRQITEEYRGRAVLELLQNAHDALLDAAPDDPRQVSFILRTAPKPVLWIANSGAAFRRKNFKGLCNLGQSPKDPNKSVGNKGLGFRSVLEICSSPAIWSLPAAPRLPAYCFGFDPEVRDEVLAVAAAIWKDGSAPSPWNADIPAVDWTPGNLANFRSKIPRPEALAEIREALSPYQFPLPVGPPTSESPCAAPSRTRHRR